MKRTMSLAIGVLMLLGLGAPANANHGDLPPRAPFILNGATTYVYPRTAYTLGCIDYMALLSGMPSTMTMIGYTLSDLKGKKILSNIVVSDRFRGEYITASAAGTTVSRLTTPTPNANPGSYITTYTIKPKAIGILRIGAAAWDGAVLCFLAQGNSFAGIQLMQQPSSQARFMYPSDLGGGVGVGTTTASVAALQSYSHTVKGYLFALFRPDSGAAKITDPKGRVRFDSTTSASRNVSIAEASKGSWTFSLDANVTRSRAPALWIMEIR
jgi:hypothetical protein